MPHVSTRIVNELTRLADLHHRTAIDKAEYEQAKRFLIASVSEDAGASVRVVSELTRLCELHERGAISDREYELAKGALLAAVADRPPEADAGPVCSLGAESERLERLLRSANRVKRNGQRPFGCSVKRAAPPIAKGQSIPGGLRHVVHIRLTDPDAKASLCEFFAAPWADVRPTEDADIVAVALPGAYSARRERIEVAAYLGPGERCTAAARSRSSRRRRVSSRAAERPSNRRPAGGSSTGRRFWCVEECPAAVVYGARPRRTKVTLRRRPRPPAGVRGEVGDGVPGASTRFRCKSRSLRRSDQFLHREQVRDRPQRAGKEGCGRVRGACGGGSTGFNPR